MISLRKTSLLALLSVTLLFALSSCKKDDDDDNPAAPAEKSIAQLATENGYDSLVVALSEAGLVTTFSNPGSYTVFAPSNQAFVDLLDDLGLDRINQIPDATLLAVLQYHVISGEVFSSSLSENLIAKTLGDYTVRFTLTGGAKVWTDNTTSANITGVDINASNGVIHSINKVLVPNTPTSAPTDNIAELAIGSSELDSLVVALSRAGLVSTFEGSTVYTVFAPNNQAFRDLCTALSVNSIAEIPLGTLTEVLTYHVSPGYLFSGQLVTGMEISTLDDETVEVVNGPALRGNGNTSNVSVVTANVRATNGVVHIVDTVILP